MKMITKKTDLLLAWNETEEAICSLESLTDEETIECKNSILTRLRIVLSTLGKYVSEEDVAKNLNL
jgi:hypothetical protein